MDGRPGQETIKDLDTQVFASLLPSVVKLYQLASSSVEPNRQLEIAKLATALKESLSTAQKQAREMPGAELTLEDQREIIAILEKEVSKRKQG